MQTLYEAWQKQRSSELAGLAVTGMDHYKVIDGHKVNIGFNLYHNNNDFNDHYPNDPHVISFTVNNSTDQKYNKDIKPESAIKILNHVHKRIDQYVRHIKPKRIEMEAVEPVKGQLYHQLAHKLAKKHGGTVESIVNDSEMHDSAATSRYQYDPKQKWKPGEDKSVVHTVKFNWDKK